MKLKTILLLGIIVLLAVGLSEAGKSRKTKHRMSDNRDDGADGEKHGYHETEREHKENPHEKDRRDREHKHEDEKKSSEENEKDETKPTNATVALAKLRGRRTHTAHEVEHRQEEDQQTRARRHHNRHRSHLYRHERGRKHRHHGKHRHGHRGIGESHFDRFHRQRRHETLGKATELNDGKRHDVVASKEVSASSTNSTMRRLRRTHHHDQAGGHHKHDEKHRKPDEENLNIDETRSKRSLNPHMRLGYAMRHLNPEYQQSNQVKNGHYHHDLKPVWFFCYTIESWTLGLQTHALVEKNKN
ncbi:hypothetical protein L596_004053 [Steinernema carpocapsae]|uniref:Uncharacterized protein n=1 Tax=Steinernema carpocapsae TaxID=34508 RepID=A0A4U8UYN1_STECR|nr:hypothetical protein L596_004053 [Steinernema carpocapsae]